MVLRALHGSIYLSSEEFWDMDHYNLIFHTENQATDTLDNLLKVTHLISYEAWLPNSGSPARAQAPYHMQYPFPNSQGMLINIP